MGMKSRSASKQHPTEVWRALALGYPEVEVSPSCTRSAFRARKKGFLFVGVKQESYNAMVKLGPSRAEALDLARREPEHYKVGSTGWTTITFRHDEVPPSGLIERWIDESYRTLVPKQLVALLP